LPRSSHLSRATHHHAQYRPCLHLASTTSPTISKRFRNLHNMANKPTIPEWQRASADNAAAPSEPEEARAQHAVEAPTPTEDDVEKDDKEEQPSESSELLDQASRFLEDDTIRDAPREKKVAFLQSKGVRPKDIETLLGQEPQESTNTELEAVGERAWSEVSAGTLLLKRLKPRPSTVSQKKDTDAYRHRQSRPRHPKSHLSLAKSSFSPAKFPRSSPIQSSSPTPKSHHHS